MWLIKKREKPRYFSKQLIEFQKTYDYIVLLNTQIQMELKLMFFLDFYLFTRRYLLNSSFLNEK